MVSGTPIHRPKGQTRVDGRTVSGLCQKLDFEVEFAAFISTGNEFGSLITVDEAEDHVFGFVLLNDWSARDFQKNELAPFTSKNFATTISPWIVPLDALEHFRTTPTNGNVSRQCQSTCAKLTDSSVSYQTISSRRRLILPMTFLFMQLWVVSNPTLVPNSELSREWTNSECSVDGHKYHVAECNTNNVVFSVAQMIAHHSRGGCALRPGDLLATGTISGPSKEREGCFMELSYSGTKPYTLSDNSDSSKTIQRTYLEDGDEVTFTSQLKHSDGRGNVGFGLCQGRILPGK